MNDNNLPTQNNNPPIKEDSNLEDKQPPATTHQ